MKEKDLKNLGLDGVLILKKGIYMVTFFDSLGGMRNLQLEPTNLRHSHQNLEFSASC